MSFYAPRFADGPPNTVPDYIVQNIPGAGGGLGGLILLSNATIADTAGIGTAVGTLTVTGGSTRTYTFSLTSNPGGLFSVGGSTLAVAAALTAGTDTITVRASDTGVSVLTRGFDITVTSTTAAAFVPTYLYFGF